MSVYRFDELVSAVQASLLTAQAAMEQRYIETIQQDCSITAHGEHRPKTLSFVMPSGEHPEESEQTVTLPLMNFRSRQIPQIAGLSLAFDCTLHWDHASGETEAKQLMIKIQDQARRPQKDLHRIEIVFEGANRPTGEIKIDGELFKVVPSPEITQSA